MTNTATKIIFLHHSTGIGVWKGNINKLIFKLTGKGDVERLIDNHNKRNNTNYIIRELSFPKKELYGWKNYPFDYYNIWIKNAGNEPYLNEPTLEMLASEYNVIIFKHCYPVSSIKADSGSSDLNSELKTIGNYKLQYNALKQKLLTFPKTKFIIWTGAALTQAKTNEAEAARAKEFFSWIKETWNEEGDNIYLWDFFELETEGGLYLKDIYAVNPNNPHPSKKFNAYAAKLFVSRLTDIIENDGQTTNIKGEKR